MTTGRGSGQAGKATHRPHRSVTRVFEEDPSLLGAVPEAEAGKLQRHVTVPLEVVPRGRWRPPLAEVGQEPGRLVLAGHLTREIEIFGRSALELVGPGDLLAPWQGSEVDSIPAAVRWQALTDSRLAVIDRDFLRAIARWPDIQIELQGRGVRRGRLTAVQLALARLRRVSVRLHLLFWHLADRWGEHEEEAIILRLPLSHRLLASLASANREAATRALGELSRRRLVTRRPDNVWAVHPPPPSQVEQLESLVSAL